MEEEWRDIPGFSGYQASSLGRIAGQLGPLKLHKLNSGYLGCSLHGIGGKTTTTVQRLTLLAFVGRPPTPSHEANHKNGDKHDNAPSNLEWLTPGENKRHAVDVLGYKPGRKRIDRPAPAILPPLLIDLRGAGGPHWRCEHKPGTCQWRVFDADTGERVRCGLIGGIIGAAHKMTPRALAARNFEGM